MHAVNTNRTRSIQADLRVDGMKIVGGRTFTLAANPEFEVFEHRSDVLEPLEQPLPAGGRWTFPAASVTAVELDTDGKEDER
jgi:hypothetical protein